MLNLRRLRKVVSVGAEWTRSDKLIHLSGPATAKACSANLCGILKQLDIDIAVVMIVVQVSMWQVWNDKLNSLCRPGLSRVEICIQSSTS